MVRETSWEYIPNPPETLICHVNGGPSYVFYCIGNVPSGENEEGDLIRVFVPDPSTPYNKKIINELKEKHGRYAKTKRSAKEISDFTIKSNIDDIPAK